jgi:transposase
VKNGEFMVRPCKLTKDVTKRIGDNIALGLTYSLASEAFGITYQTLNSWLNRGKTEKSGKYHQLYKHIQKRNSDAAKALLERLNEAIDVGNCQVCMFILERHFPDEFGRRVYRKINSVPENQNVIVDIAINDADRLRAKILDKFDRVGKSNESLTN